MHRFYLLLLLALPVGVLADQTEPQLQDLFLVLKETDDPTEAYRVESTIWRIWTRHDDERFNSLMLKGIGEMNRNALYAALDTFDELIAMAPDFAEAWNKRATIYYLVGQYDASLRDIDEVLKLEPFHFGALSGQGLVHMAKGEYFQARASFLSVLEVYPSMPGVKNNIRMLEEMLESRSI